MIGRYPSANGIKLAATCHDLTLRSKQGCIAQLSKSDVIQRDQCCNRRAGGRCTWQI